MAESGKNPSSRQCAQCGVELAANLPDELCPKCLLKAALGTQPILGPTGTVGLPPVVAISRGLPQPGEELGHYRIVRVLGQGGMGAAFEAEDLENGRRVALKVLSHTLDSPDARERFFREGRLAASINHSNSVYVFGTEEICGTPVIAMELVAGGTLQDCVNAQGPLPVGEAVDAVLQIISGLEAAQRIGILHRDVKPSNCFRDHDGTVKIGDFGLSISTAIRTEPALTASGAFLGTPAFCSPEQLRGDELNVRSDMYAVGATLFFLLTGRTPFEGKTSVQLLANVLEQRVRSPKELRADIPRGLARVVLRCLEKQPGDRFKNYAELAQALAPYSSAAPTPATLGLRFVAGALDQCILGLACTLVAMLFTGDFLGVLEAGTRPSPELFALMFGGFTLGVGYFAVMEGFWGFTLGKVICRLRVVGRDNSPPGFWRALGRALIYVMLPPLPYWIIFGGDTRAYLNEPQAVQYLVSFSFFIALLVLFCTARRRNGFAAIHDLLTRTQVIAQAALVSRPELGMGEPPPSAGTGQRLVGPYHILETLQATGDEEWLLGYDLRLLRKVWLRVGAPGMPAVPAALRNVGRVGRLRWLTGRRSAGENWDAFEAASGRPLLSLVEIGQPWSRVRFWLYDLANEISAAERDGTMPDKLALDRVWITADGRAKLLDFPAPGIGASSPAIQPAQEFLHEVATASLSGQGSSAESPRGKTQPRLPLHALNFLTSLPALPSAQAIAGALHPLLNRVAEVSRLRRAAIVAGCLAFPILATCGMFFGLSMLERWNARNPGLMELSTLLHLRDGMNSRWAKHQPHPTDRQFAIYIKRHYSEIITNEARWTDVFALSLIKGNQRRFAEQSMAGQPEPTEKEIADAEAAVGKHQPPTDSLAFKRKPWFPAAVFSMTLAIYVGVPAIIAALLFRGGLILLVSGVAFVRRDGALASRLRVFWRALVAWSPMLAAPFVFGFLMRPAGGLVAGAVAACLVVGLAAVSVALPGRGLADRFAGTWPVPR